MPNKIFSNLLIATIVLLPLYILRFKIGPLPSTILEVLIFLTFIFFIISKNYRKVKVDKVFWIGVLLVAVTCAAGFLDPDKMRGLGLWKALFLDGFLLFLMARVAVERERRKLVQALILSGLITSLTAIILYLVGVKSADHRLLDLDRLSPNYLAMYLSPILIISLAYLKDRFRTKMPFSFGLISSVLMIVALILTGSRGAAVALAAGLIILLYGSFKNQKNKKIANFGLILLSVALLTATFWVYKPDWSDQGRKATSSNVRYYIWSTSFEMIKLNPIWGVGLGNYQNYFSSLTKDRVNYPEFISPQALTAHNLYLQTYLTCGLLGFIVFVIFLVSLKFWKLKHLAISAAFITLLIYGLVDTPLFRNDLAACFWILTALLL